MNTTKQLLKCLAKNKETLVLRDILEKSNLTELEYWVLYYAFIDGNGQGRMVENTCNKLGIGKSKYHTTLNEGLIKVDYTIKNEFKLRIIH